MTIGRHGQRRSAWVGIDIAPEAVHLVQLADEAGTGWQISHAASVALPAGAVFGAQMAEPMAVGAAIAQARRQAGAWARQAVMALAAPAAVLRVLSMPAGLSAADLEAQVELEATRDLPAGQGEIALDFQVLGPVLDEPARNQVLLAVAQMEAVRRCEVALAAGGLHALAVEVDSLALARAVQVLGGNVVGVQELLTLTRHSVMAAASGCNLAPELLLACGLALWGRIDGRSP